MSNDRHPGQAPARRPGQPDHAGECRRQRRPGRGPGGHPAILPHVRPVRGHPPPWRRPAQDPPRSSGRYQCSAARWSATRQPEGLLLRGEVQRDQPPGRAGHDRVGQLAAPAGAEAHWCTSCPARRSTSPPPAIASIASAQAGGAAGVSRSDSTRPVVTATACWPRTVRTSSGRGRVDAADLRLDADRLAGHRQHPADGAEHRAGVLQRGHRVAEQLHQAAAAAGCRPRARRPSADARGPPSIAGRRPGRSPADATVGGEAVLEQPGAAPGRPGGPRPARPAPAADHPAAGHPARPAAGRWSRRRHRP